MKKDIRTERANLFEPDVYISMVVKITGNVSKEAVRHAVENAYRANEATMSEIVLTKHGEAYYEKKTSSGCRVFMENRSWPELLRQSEKEVFHLKDGELVRVFLTEEDEKLVLFIHAHHLVGDGRSVLILLKDYPTGKTVGIPVSIREEDKGMSNQVSGIVVKAKYNRKQSFEENLRTVHRRIYKEIRSRNKKYFVLLFMEYLCPSLTDAVLLQTHGCYQNNLSEKMARIMGYMGEGGSDLGVTNLNQIDIPDKYTNFTIESIQFIPPSVSYTKNVIGISTFQDILTVSRKT